ncbi:MAG: DUF4238 domain-containing protein [Oligoflexia bacterium]|nr:DUF4238 domain-containing protein [Oligoflexia bacterium]
MSQPRRHHYCPQFYLSGFTEDSRPDGRLWAIDKTTKLARPSKPNLEAHQRDFYRIDVQEGADPFYLEREFSKIEDGTRHAIAHVVSTGTMPDIEGYGFLMSFIGLQAVRTPWHREWHGEFMRDIAKKMIQISCASKERFEQMYERLRESDSDIPEGVSYDDMRAFVDGERYRIEIDQTFQIDAMLKMASTITDLLIPRNWTIVFSNCDTNFVTSDNPVGLAWHSDVPGPYSPGFGLKNTEVTFPLNKRVALVGMFEPMPAIAQMSEAAVASLNNHAIRRATRHIYSATEDFAWYSSENRVEGRSALFQAEETDRSEP